jgi:hypothetical protein
MIWEIIKTTFAAWGILSAIATVVVLMIANREMERAERSEDR